MKRFVKAVLKRFKRRTIPRGAEGTHVGNPEDFEQTPLQEDANGHVKATLLVLED